MSFLALAIIGLVSIPVMAQSGGPYTLTRFAVEGGGGKSAGGSYQVVGTIGQPDAGTVSAGAYSLRGGFMGFVHSVFDVLQTIFLPLVTR